MQSRHWLSGLALLLLAAPAATDPLTANTSLERLPARAMSAELEISSFDADAYHSEGPSQRIPGDLRFVTAHLRVSWAPSARLAYGAEIPYRIVEYAPALGSGELRNRGVAGAAVFVDLSHDFLQGDATLRVGYLRTAKVDDPVLSISDGADRLSVTYAIAAGEDVRPWTGYLRAGFVGARARLPEESQYGQGWIQIAAGRRIAPRIDLLLAASSSIATSAREEGSFLSKRTSRGNDAGLMLQWFVTEDVRMRLSATQTFGLVERLDGLRVVLSSRLLFR
ncbi:MAG TPA: hypothetical protein VMS98_20640 [Thermoanaerobaculia bacterium]|nr:hypothetical protein [Thermoanaerobaculia bacterium]